MSLITPDVKDAEQMVNRLIETCRDGQDGFTFAGRAVSNQEIKSELFQYARQRGQFVAELERRLQDFGQTPVTHGSFSGAVHRGWMNLRQAVSAKDDYVILAECERGEDSALLAYRETMAANIPVQFEDIVKSQHREIELVHKRIRELRDAIKASRPE